MPIGLAYPDWQKERGSWPNAEHSRFVSAGRHLWHVQRMGQGQKVLLLHGLAASSHSFAPLAEELRPHFELMIPDLPGHGFTRSPPLRPVSPDTVAEDLLKLLEAEDYTPSVLAGHSAGAAVSLKLASLMKEKPSLVIGINGAFQPFGGLARFIAPAIAKMLYLNPLTAMTFAAGAKNGDRVRSLIEQTGSEASDRIVDPYRRLLQYSGHVSGALAMMSGWTLDGVDRWIRDSGAPVLLLAGERDNAVPPDQSAELADRFDQVSVEVLPGAGHLAHEEDPQGIAALLIERALRRSDGTAQAGSRR